MSKDEIFNYVMETPGNTNPNVLKSLLDNLPAESDGGNNGAIVYELRPIEEVDSYIYVYEINCSAKDLIEADTPNIIIVETATNEYTNTDTGDVYNNTTKLIGYLTNSFYEVKDGDPDYFLGEFTFRLNNSSSTIYVTFEAHDIEGHPEATIDFGAFIFQKEVTIGTIEQYTTSGGSTANRIILPPSVVQTSSYIICVYISGDGVEFLPVIKLSSNWLIIERKIITTNPNSITSEPWVFNLSNGVYTDENGSSPK